MARRAKWESLGGCLRPWRDGRLRGLLARITRLRQNRPRRIIVPKSPRVSARGVLFSEGAHPWLDDRLKKLVEHIEQLRRSGLIGPSR